MKIHIRLILTCSLILFPIVCSAVDKPLFDSLIAEIKKREYENTEKFLRDKKESYKKDPEYYVILLNYAVHKADQSQFTIGQGKPREGEYALKDEKGNTAGFLGVRGGYDADIIVDAINRTRKAMPHFENRLDIHFGIITLAQQIKHWDIIATQMVDVLKISRSNSNNWQWGPISSLDGDPKEFMLSNIQGHAGRLFKQETEEADQALRKIASALIKYYPKNVMGYANMGTLHAVKKEYAQAEQYYRDALKIAPNDEIVKANIKRLEQLKSEKKP